MIDRRAMFFAAPALAGCATGGSAITVASGAKPSEFRLRRNKAGEWYFTLRASNGEPIVVSEGYKNLSDCENAVDIVTRSSDANIVVETG